MGTNEETETITALSNGNELVKAMGEDLGQGVMPPTWDPNRVYLYEDPDGNKVPVPYGFTVSGAESEKYVNHNVTKKGTRTDLTFSSTGDYSWTQDENTGIWKSGNYHVANSTSELVSNEIEVGADGGYVSVEWSVCSRSGYDLLSMTVIDTINETEDKMLKEISGTIYGTTEANLEYTTYGKELEAGKYKISIKYTKNNHTTHTGLDSGYIKSGSYLHYDDAGEDSITFHKTGGLVIYEGTGEVTDSNCWEESKNRNQFVWVPVPDTERVYTTQLTTGKKKGILYNYNSAGERTRITNNYTDTSGEPSIGLNRNPGDKLRTLALYGRQGYTKDIYYKELQSDFNDCIESIERYKGFFVGRYETAYVSGTPVTRRLRSSQNTKTVIALLDSVKNISSCPNIKSDFMYGCLWYELLEWIVDTGDKSRKEVARDSTNWGNYQNAQFEYLDGGGTIYNKKAGVNKYCTTGSTERNKANNIYDLAGNVLDVTRQNFDTTSLGWTAYGGQGDYVSSSSATYLQGNITPAVNKLNYGSNEYGVGERCATPRIIIFIR